MQTKQQITLTVRSLIEPSDTNQRQDSGLSPEQLSELALSIRDKGIIQPLIVRPHPKKKNHFELVAGERRYLASEPGFKVHHADGKTEKLAGLEELPCIVRELSDREALEIQTIENLQRENLNELEEAEGYAQMLALREDSRTSNDESRKPDSPRPSTLDPRPIYTIETLAAKLSKSVAFIYSRLKLLKVPEAAQKALREGRLNASQSLLIARIPNAKDAATATEEILHPRGNKDADPLSYRATKLLIQENFMRRLKGAPFDQNDPTLVPANGPKDTFGFTEFGPCATCKFRTGNMRKLDPTIESSDVCTNLSCFAKKTEATNLRKLAELKKDGATVIPPSSPSKGEDRGEGQYFHREYNRNRYDTPEKDRYATSDTYNLSTSYTSLYIPVDASCQYHEGKKEKTWKEALGKDAPKPVVLTDPTGTPHLAYLRKDLKDASKKAGLKVPDHYLVGTTSTSSQTDEATRKARAAENRKVKLKLLGYRAVCSALTNSIHHPDPKDHPKGSADPSSALHVEFIKLLALSAADQSSHDTKYELVNRRGLNLKDGKKIVGANMHDLFDKHVKKLETAADYRTLLAEMLLMPKLFSYTSEKFPRDEIKDAFKLFRVDDKAILEKVIAEDGKRSQELESRIQKKGSAGGPPAVERGSRSTSKNPADMTEKEFTKHLDKVNPKVKKPKKAKKLKKAKKAKSKK